MNAREYYDSLQSLVTASPLVASTDLQFREIDVNECYIRGVLTLANGFELHLAEYIATAPEIRRPKYRYHLQQPDGTRVARWDNAPHHPEIQTHPHHRHAADDSLHESPEMSPELVLAAIVPLIEAE
ncbi:MAG: hypothetical protein HY023_04330 [Chloroflexi bacterium]|nr:hypothetical protein [Chloroflexota bacterium]